MLLAVVFLTHGAPTEAPSAALKPRALSTTRDASDALVAAYTKDALKSCAEVSTSGFCHQSVAQSFCPVS